MNEQPMTGGVGGPGSRVSFESCTFEVRDDKAKVAVRLRNSGETAAFVISQVRRLTLDDGGDTLTLWLTERGAPVPARPLRHLTIPAVTALRTGEERTIQAELPVKMTRLVAMLGGGELDFEVLAVGAAGRVVVKLSVAETPFYFNPGREDLLAQLQSWGEDIEVTAERTRPQEADERR